MRAWKITYDDRRVEYVPGEDLIEAVWTARRLLPTYGLDRIKMVEFQRVVA